MRTKLGVVGGCLMVLGALVASSANTKTAEAHSNTSAPVSMRAPVAGSDAQPAAPQRSTSEIPASVALLPAATRAASLEEIITPPPADLLLEDPKLRRMQPREITRGMLDVAAKIVRKHYAKPVGTQIEVEVDGQRVVARIERHFHPEGGPVKPWGFHPGVSLFARR